MRGFLIFVLLGAVVLVGADLAARRYAEGRAATTLAGSLELEGNPEVSFEGFPFLVHAFRGSVPEVRADIGRLSVRDVALRDVRIVLRDVGFSFWELVSGNARSLRARSGTGQVRLTASALEELLRRSGQDPTVSIQGGDIKVRYGRGAPSRVVDPSVDGSVLVLAGRGTPAVTIDLPRVAEGVSYGTVQVDRGALVLSLELADSVLDLSHATTRPAASNSVRSDPVRVTARR